MIKGAHSHSPPDTIPRSISHWVPIKRLEWPYLLSGELPLLAWPSIAILMSILLYYKDCGKHKKLHYVHYMPQILNNTAHIFRSTPKVLIVGGDFNLTQSATADRQMVGPQASSPRVLRDSRLFRQISRRYALFDAWRALRPGDRQYTFYSALHRTHFRIDYFLVNNQTLKLTCTAQILPISGSDHAPISLTLDLGTPIRRP